MPPPPRKVRKTFFDEKKNYIFCLKVPSKCRKCHFRDPNFKMGFQTYIFCSNVPSKCRKCRYFSETQISKNFRTHLQLCRHYGLPLTKILATPLLDMVMETVQYVHIFSIIPCLLLRKHNCKCF